MPAQLGGTRCVRSCRIGACRGKSGKSGWESASKESTDRTKDKVAARKKVTQPMEFIVELLLEFFIQIVGETLAGLGLHVVAEPFRKPPNPWIAATGYVIFGTVLGAISLWPFPDHMVANPVWRWINLLVTPPAVGLCMSWQGAWRARHGKTVFRIDRFSYGWLFSLFFATVRLKWAN